MQIRFTAEEIIQIAKPLRTLGSTSTTLTNIAGLDDAQAGDISFLANPKYRDAVRSSKASLIFLPADWVGEPPENQQWLLLENPSLAITQLCSRLEQLLWPKPSPGIHPSAVIAANASVHASASIGPLCVVEADAQIGENTVIEAQSFVGRGAKIGPGCWIKQRVVIAAACELGARVCIQPGAVIGSDGFGYETIKGRHEKIPQVGNVVLGDDVEVGANTTIDRARFSRTYIGEGTKIDNLVQIAHNVTTGRHCILVAQVGIAGSTRLGDYVVMGGQVGVGGHLNIGSFAKVGGQAGVTRDVEAKAYVLGYHAVPYMLEQKFQVLRTRLPELFRRVENVEQQLGIGKKPSA